MSSCRSDSSRNVGVTVVIPTRDEPMLPQTVCGLLETLPPDSEVVVVDDGSTDRSVEELPAAPNIRVIRGGGLGVAGARNLGASEARGEHICFCDAHLRFPPGWWEPLEEALSNPAVALAGPAIADMASPASVGYGLRWTGPGMGVEWLGCLGSRPYAVPLLGGACMAVRADRFRELGGFDPGMTGWGSEDVELCLRSWLLGFETRLAPGVCVGHLFRAATPYAIDWPMVVHNQLRTAFAHFSQQRLERVIEAMRQTAGFPAAMARCAAGNIWERRRALAERRVRDDDWFFSSMGMRC